MKGEISSVDIEFGSVLSSSHNIVAREKEGVVHVTLAMEPEAPDRDFFLEWKQSANTGGQSVAWSYERDGVVYALVQLRAPDIAAEPDLKPCDFYFLVDRSGSMGGMKWTKTCEALRALVSKLQPHDRVWITLFESSYIDVTKRPVPVTELMRRVAFRRFEALGANGGTELIPAALHVLEAMRTFSENRRKRVIIITDGQVGNEADVIACFKVAGNDFSAFTFGIDTAVNDALLETLARNHQGTCTLLSPQDDIVSAVAGLAGRLCKPLFTDLRVIDGWQAITPDTFSLYPRGTVVRSLRCEGNAQTLQFRGHSADGAATTLEIPLIKTENLSIELLWHKARIQHLLKTNQQAKALGLALRHNLQCPDTCYIAWDEAEKVQIAFEYIDQSITELKQVAACCGKSCELVGEETAQVDPYPCREVMISLVEAIGLPASFQHHVIYICFRHIPRGTEKIPQEIRQWCESLLANRKDLDACFDVCREFIETYRATDNDYYGLLEKLDEFRILHAFESEQ